MGMSIKDQLEHIAKTFENKAIDYKLKKENEMYDEHYINIINCFNKEVYQYFANPEIKENSLTQCTQLMWYRLFLERKRLNKLGLRKVYTRSNTIQKIKNSNNHSLVYMNYKHDGKNMICKVGDKTNYLERYYYEGKKKYNVFCGKNCRDYFISSSKFRTLKECACMNCGAVMNVEQLIDGCDYCGTKYSLEDLKGKVSSYYEKNTNADSRRGAPIILVLLAAACFSMSLLTLAFIPIAIIVTIITMMYIANNGQKTTESLLKLERKINLLSKEALFSDIENKLYILHYCDDEKDLETICNCKLKVNYKNVLTCDTQKYFIKNISFSPDDEWVYMTCKIFLNIRYFENSKIKQRKEIVEFKMVRSLQSLKEIKPDFLVYKCKSCNASISLLNGGRCDYCGEKLELEKFDWKIVEYKSNW